MSAYHHRSRSMCALQLVAMCDCPARHVVRTAGRLTEPCDGFWANRTFWFMLYFPGRLYSKERCESFVWRQARCEKFRWSLSFSCTEPSAGFQTWGYPNSYRCFFLVENCIKMDNLGVPLFQETSIYLQFAKFVLMFPSGRITPTFSPPFSGLQPISVRFHPRPTWASRVDRDITLSDFEGN